MACWSFSRPAQCQGALVSWCRFALNFFWSFCEMSASPAVKSSIKRVAMLFSGGPAPAANAVISTAASSFIKHGIEVFGLKHGYSSLSKFSPDYSLQEGRDFIKLDSQRLRRTRNTQGIMIG